MSKPAKSQVISDLNTLLEAHCQRLRSFGRENPLPRQVEADITHLVGETEIARRRLARILSEGGDG